MSNFSNGFYIEKEAPINDERNKKKSIYYIKDNLSLFYYTYVYRYLSQRGIMNEEIEQIQKAGLPCYRYGFVSKSGFEDIVNEDLLLYTLDDLYV